MKNKFIDFQNISDTKAQKSPIARFLRSRIRFLVVPPFIDDFWFEKVSLFLSCSDFQE